MRGAVVNKYLNSRYHFNWKRQEASLGEASQYLSEGVCDQGVKLGFRKCTILLCCKPYLYIVVKLVILKLDQHIIIMSIVRSYEDKIPEISILG